MPNGKPKNEKWNDKLRTLGTEIQRLDQEQKNYVVIAQSSGRLVNFIGIQKGSFLSQGQTLGEISPEQNLTIECSVSPKDIGFIHRGQKVKFQVDTFNYNQWGLLEGEVLDIDQNITMNQQTGELMSFLIMQIMLFCVSLEYFLAKMSISSYNHNALYLC